MKWRALVVVALLPVAGCGFGAGDKTCLLYTSDAADE